jgi:hypothetical protein
MAARIPSPARDQRCLSVPVATSPGGRGVTKQTAVLRNARKTSGAGRAWVATATL